jgi:hypothetical protein
MSQIMAVARMVAEGRAQHLREDTRPRPGWRAVCTHMSGRLEDARAFRGVIDKDNLDIDAWELRASPESPVPRAQPADQDVYCPRVRQTGRQDDYPASNTRAEPVYTVRLRWRRPHHHVTVIEGTLG